MDKVKIEFTRPHMWKYIEPIVPAIHAVPQWYKDKKRASLNALPYEPDQGTIKACPAMFDSMSQGYILPLWIDLYVEPTQNPENGEIMPSFFWGKGVNGPADTPLMTMFSIEMTNGMPNADKTKLPSFKLNSPWILKTPKGYSTLFIAPLNNRDIMFEAISGVIHTDVFTTYINIPFIWTGPPDFKGVIKKGTPLVQMIPFKRDAFEHEIGFISPEEEAEENACSLAVKGSFGGGYRQVVSQRHEGVN
jgi:hypothetical protein|tara:strand:- start:1050 stop:1793 length:744 start_codon:yes stop_codon:yes gene_type:complete